MQSGFFMHSAYSPDYFTPFLLHVVLGGFCAWSVKGSTWGWGCSVWACLSLLSSSFGHLWPREVFFLVLLGIGLLTLVFSLFSSLSNSLFSALPLQCNTGRLWPSLFPTRYHIKLCWRPNFKKRDSVTYLIRSTLWPKSQSYLTKTCFTQSKSARKNKRDAWLGQTLQKTGLFFSNRDVTGLSV